MKVITICGSLKYKKEQLEIAQKLVLEGNCVITPNYFEHIDEITEEEVLKLKECHFKKIEISDEIYVVNVNNYIGESTKLEIEHAKKHNKKIRYYIN